MTDTDISKADGDEKQRPKPLHATHGSADKPLRIDDVEIPCYVLEDGTRVITQRGVQTGIGMSTSGGSGGAHRMARWVGSLLAKGLQESHTGDLAVRIENPILFYPSGMNRLAYGYEATVLADLCEFVLKARDAGLLEKAQSHIADQSELLMRAFARVGIIALVDEATGYQETRARDALEEILRRFISKELSQWVKTFPDEFYENLFRLRDWHYSEFTSKRPGVAGRITNDIVYQRLAPGVLEELQRITPRDQKGRRKHKYFQRLTEDAGHPKLREHLASVITLMKVSTNWRRFYGLLNRALPKYNTTPTMFPEYDEEPDGDN